VTSSLIRAVGYDAAALRLYVEFHSGDVYAYEWVSRRAHRELMEAPSIGAYFNREIRPRHAFSQL
jgi:hypothetical protein